MNRSTNHNDFFAAAPARSNSGGRFRAPGRWKSSASVDRSPLDNIGECEVFVPTKPQRHKSTEELEANLLVGWESEDEALQDDMVDSLAGDMEGLELDMSDMTDDAASLNCNAQHNRRSRPSNIMTADSFCSVDSFYSYGSSMTVMQEHQPGRFITPQNSFQASTESVNRALPDCEGVAQQVRATFDASKFFSADHSFRLPLLRNESMQSVRVERAASNAGDNLLTSTPPKNKPESSEADKESPRSVLLQFGGSFPSLPLVNSPVTATRSEQAEVDSVQQEQEEPTFLVSAPQGNTEESSHSQPPRTSLPTVRLDAEEEQSPAPEASPTPAPRRFGLQRKASIYRLGQ